LKYYIASDLHGFYTEFQKALTAAGYYEDPSPKKLLLLGDLFDRGTEAVKLQNWVLKLLEQNTIILIRGNHEDLLEDLICKDQGRALQHHISNGTYDTLLQLTGHEQHPEISEIELSKQGAETPFMKKILPAMRNYYETDSYVFVHGFVPYTRMLGDRYLDEKNWRDASEERWRESRWYNPMAAFMAWKEQKTVVAGHWHASYGHSRLEGIGPEFGKNADFSPFYGRKLIAIDGCTSYSHQVNVLVLEDEE